MTCCGLQVTTSPESTPLCSSFLHSSWAWSRDLTLQRESSSKHDVKSWLPVIFPLETQIPCRKENSAKEWKGRPGGGALEWEDIRRGTPALVSSQQNKATSGQSPHRNQHPVNPENQEKQLITVVLSHYVSGQSVLWQWIPNRACYSLSEFFCPFIAFLNYFTDQHLSNKEDRGNEKKWNSNQFGYLLKFWEKGENLII